MSVIDVLTVGCTAGMPRDDRAVRALSLVDQAFRLLYGPQSTWSAKQKLAYETCVSEIWDAVDAERAESPKAGDQWRAEMFGAPLPTRPDPVDVPGQSLKDIRTAAGGGDRG